MNKHLKHILYLSIWTFTVVVVWIVVLVVQQASQTALSSDVLEAAEPIDASFDAQALHRLGDRVLIPVDLSSPAPEFELVEIIEPVVPENETEEQ